MITGDQKQEYLDFFNDILSLNMTLDDLAMLTETNQAGQPLAVVGFFNTNVNNMEVCVASKEGWSATRRFARICFDYAFFQCGVYRITCHARVSNIKSIAFQLRMGFDREFNGVLKHWFGDEDGIQFVMLKENCKWLKGNK